MYLSGLSDVLKVVLKGRVLNALNIVVVQRKTVNLGWHRTNCIF